MCYFQSILIESLLVKLKAPISNKCARQITRPMLTFERTAMGRILIARADNDYSSFPRKDSDIKVKLKYLGRVIHLGY